MTDLATSLDGFDDERSYGPVFIVLSESGALWTRQAGCIGCKHPTARGMLEPVPRGADDLRECWFSCGDITAPGMVEDHIRSLNERLEFARSPFRFDPARASEAMEAWVPVVDPAGRRAILTWENCD